MTFGGRLRELRIEKGISQEELAKTLGVKPQTVSRWEKDFREPDHYYTVEIAKYFNVTTDYLLGLQG
jgi:transcriptional regulator with XRE-family HTH domain